MANKTLYVRIFPKAGPETFFRCGMQFSRTWKKQEVDKATAERLESEQMLEVTEKEPEDYVSEENADAKAKAVTTAAKKR